MGAVELTRRGFLAGAAALAVAGPAGLAGRAPRPLALVTADLEAAIAVVDPRTLRVVRRIACPEHPRSIESIGSAAALVAHTDDGRLSVVDARRMRVGAVIGGFGAPRYAAVTADGRLAYVTDSAAGQVVTVDLTRSRIIRRTDVGGPARHLGLTPDGRVLWTALGSVAPRVAVLDLADPRRPRLRRSFAPPFAAHDVVADPAAPRLWVTSGDRRAVALYDRAGGEPLRVLAADAPPQHVAFAGGIAFVASGDDGTLRLHRARDGRRMWTSRVPAGSYNVAALEGLAITPSLARGTLAATRPPARAAPAAAVARSAHDACLVTA